MSARFDADAATVKFRYARAVDTRDWATYRSLFADQVHVDFSEFAGTARRVTAEEWTRDVALQMDGLDSTQHLISNVLADVRPGGMTVTSELQAMHVFRDVDGTRRHYLIGASYTDHLVRSGDELRIAGLTLHIRWTTGDPTVMRDAVRRSRASRD